MPSDILIVPNRNSTTINPNIQFSGSAVNTIRLEAQPSGSVAFVGNSGSLFSIVDSMSGSLMAVSDVSGLPILEVFSDDRVVMGKFNSNTLVVTGSRVGVGTATPSYALDVVGSATLSAARFRSSQDYQIILSGDGTQWAGIGFTDSSATDYMWYNGQNGTFAIGGVGSNVSGKKLHVNGGMSVGTLLDSSAVPSNGLYVEGSSWLSANVAIGKTSPVNAKLDVNGNAIVTGSFNVTGNVGIGSGVTSTQKLDVLGRMKFRSDGTVSAGAWYTDSGGTENVFVGQTGTTATSAFGVFSNSAWQFAVLNGGNVGIGTITPSAKLNIYSSTADPIFRITPLGSYDGVIQITGEGDNIATEGLEIWYKNDTGDAHISTTYPSDVAAIRFHTRVGASKSTSNERFTIYGDGNIGINKASPAAKLDVNGNTIITGSLAVTGILYDSSRSAGTSGQVLSSTGTGTSWVASGAGAAPDFPPIFLLMGA